MRPTASPHIRTSRRSLVRPLGIAAAAAILLALATPAAAATHVDRDSLADSKTLLRWAREELAEGSLEARQRAMAKLRRCMRLDPAASEPGLQMGRAYEIGRPGPI